MKEVKYLNEVHGGHGEAGAVDEAADRAAEADVVDVVLVGLDVARVLLRLIPERYVNKRERRVPIIEKGDKGKKHHRKSSGREYGFERRGHSSKQSSRKKEFE